MMMCPMWMWIWGIVGILLIVLLIIVIAKLLRK
jgi:hypothetical protein